MKLVYLEWQDAHSFDVGWTSKEKMDEYANGDEFIVKQVGWVYRETKKSITLASQYVEEGVYLADGYGQIVKIPKGWIRKRKYLSI